MKSTFLAGTALAAAAFVQFTTAAMAAAADDTLIQGNVQAFLTAARSLADAADTPVKNLRADQRIMEVRATLARSFFRISADKTVSLAELKDTVLMCVPRQDYYSLTYDRDLLSTVAGKIDKTGKPSKIENLTDAAKAFFASYTIDVGAPPQTQQDFQKLKEKYRTECEAHLNGYMAAYYGATFPAPAANLNNLTVELALPIVGAVEALEGLIKAFVDTITPVVVDAAQIYDEKARLNAIHTYLRNSRVQKDIADTSRRLGAFLASYSDKRRFTAMGKSLETIGTLRATSVKLADVGECKALAQVSDTNTAKKANGQPNDAWVTCYNAVWGKVKGSVDKFVTAAEDYDTIADSSAVDVTKAVARIGELIKKFKDDDWGGNDFDQFWRDALRLVGLAQKVNDAFSKDNKDKLEGRVDALLKLFN